MHFRTVCLLTALLAAAHAAFSLSDSSNIPGYASASSTTYTFGFLSDSVQIGADWQFIVSFPTDNFAIVSVSSCTFTLDSQVAASAACSINSSANAVVFQNLTASSVTPSTVTVQFSTQSATSASSPILNVYMLDGGGTAVPQTFVSVQLTFDSATFTGCTVDSSSNVAGASVKWTVTLSPSVIAKPSESVNVQLPLWSDTTASNFQNASASCSTSCSNSYDAMAETVTLTGAISSTGTNNIVFQLTNIRNPPSLAPITLSFSISTQIGVVQQCTSTFAPSSTNVLTSLTFPNSNRSISASNQIIFNAVTSNPLPANAYLRINTSLAVGYTYVPLRPNKLQKVTTTDGTLLLSNLTSTAVSSQYPLTVGNFTLSNPKYSGKGVLVTFSTEEYINGSYYKVDAASISITADASTISTSSLAITNKTVNTITTYNVNFTTVNAITGLGTIVVVFPPETTLSAASVCTSQYQSCTVNATAVTIKVGTAVAAGASVALSITNVKNPPTTTPSSSFRIATYYSALDELVDQLTSGLTVKADPVPLASAAVIPSNTTVLAKLVDYAFTLQLTNSIPAANVISVTFPAEISLTNSLTLKAATSPCVLSQQSGQQVNLSCSAALNALNFTLSGVSNPTSTAPTSTFTLQVFYNGYLQEYMLIGLSVAMDTAALLSSVSVASSNNTVSQVANYTFSLTLSTTHYNGDRVVLSIPAQVAIGSGFQCSPVLGLVAVSCTQTSSSVIEVALTFGSFPTDNKIAFGISGFTNNWLTAPSMIGVVTTTNSTVRYYVEKGTAQLTYNAAELIFSVLQDQNIVLLSNSTLKLTVQSQYTLTKATDPTKLYLVIALPSTSFVGYSSICSSSSGTCVDATSANSYNASGFGQFSSPLSITLVANTSYFSASSDPLTVSLFYGSDLIASKTTTVSVYCQSPCQKCTATPTVCLSCLPAPYTNNNTYVPANNTCAKTCPQNTLYNASTQNCDPCTNNCATCSNTTSGCTSCVSATYLLNSSCLLACPSNYYINGSVCANCISPCLTCDTSTSCTSCVAGYNFFQNSCLSVCTDPSTIPINGNCVQCSSACLTCIGTITRCASCQNGLYLFNSSCVSLCPVGTFINGTSCSSCVAPCLTCSSSSTCLTCNSSMYFYSGTCLAVCPAGTYGNALGSCLNCSSECLTCSTLPNNCTSCRSTMYRLNNTCVSNCTPPLYPYQGACVECIDPCKTCSVLPGNCTSCLTGYLYNYSCVSSCPQGQYVVGNNTVCSPCASNCLSCTSLVNCSVCSQSTLLFEGLCLTECPSATPIIFNRTCSSCSESCRTCSLTTDNCTSCSIDKYLLRYACVSSCPIGMLSDPTTNTCVVATVTQAIFFFPFFISTVCVVLLAVFSRLFNSNTAVLAAVVSVGSLMELGSWFYNLYNQLTDVETLASRQTAVVLLAVALGLWLLLNIGFYVTITLRTKTDDYFRLWLSVAPCNYWTYVMLLHLSLLSWRFYRLLYCRLFNLHPLSMMFKNNRLIFPPTTIFAVLTVLFCEIPVVAAAILTAHNKQLKDQVFYSCVETIVLTGLIALLTLADIYKAEDFFNDTEYIRLKKYLEKSRDEQTKQQDETFLDGPILNFESENCIASAGKTSYYKSDGELLMQEDGDSTLNQNIVELDDGDACMPPPPPKRHTRINIFDAVLQQEAQYQSEYSEDSYEKAVREEANRLRPKSMDGDRPRSKLQNEDEDGESHTDEGSNAKRENDSRSVADPSSLKKRWNAMMKQRRDKARAIYREQEIQTDEPVVFRQLESVDEQPDPALQSHLNSLMAKRRKRGSRIKLNNDESMRRTAEIYLQRLEVHEDKRARVRRLREKSRRLLQAEMQKQEQRQEMPPASPASRRIREHINLDF